MIIDVSYANGTNTYISTATNYDFYPETKILSVDCTNDEVLYIPMTENVKNVFIEGGHERGYLEGHDEAC